MALGPYFESFCDHFLELWGHFLRPGRVLGTTLGHPGTQTLKKDQKDHFLGPDLGASFLNMFSLFRDMFFKSKSEALRITFFCDF